ncbi:hypothetical protein ACJIZ3_003382 [Penstemon smallii]|uniref:Uncharacterized protein n=1 Tax=Penstemon smallii TaxID=265156 RepID=A0ABD3U931_9LAMI
MDDLLQPLVDEAMLSSYSCREEWISAMVSSLSTYLAKEIFPTYVRNQTQARVSWLHLVDLMISFDKRVQSLGAHSGMLLSLQEDDNMQQMSSLAVFYERSWINESQEDNKSPLISSVVFRHLSSVIDRCRSLPSISLRGSFVKLTGGPIIRKFMEYNAARTKVAKSINAAYYFESVLQEWCEDVFFLELGFKFNQPCKLETSLMSSDAPENVEKLSTVVLRGFDARCRDYIKNKKQWQENSEEGSTLSRSFIEAVDYLQGRMSILEEGLNKMDSTKVWRSLATGIDRLIFNSIVIANVKFYDGGFERLWNDIWLT